jgi:hypothetical protein
VVARPGDGLVRTPEMQTNCHAFSLCLLVILAKPESPYWFLPLLLPVLTPYQRVRSQLIHSPYPLTRASSEAPAQ